MDESFFVCWWRLIRLRFWHSVFTLFNWTLSCKSGWRSIEGESYGKAFESLNRWSKSTSIIVSSRIFTTERGELTKWWSFMRKPLPYACLKPAFSPFLCLWDKFPLINLSFSSFSLPPTESFNFITQLQAQSIRQRRENVEKMMRIYFCKLFFEIFHMPVFPA